MNQNENKDTDYSRLIWFLLSPISFIILNSSLKKSLDSDSWTKLRLKRNIYLKASIISVIVCLFLYILIIQYISIDPKLAGLILFFTYLTHYPVAKIIQIGEFNKILKKLEQGRLDPITSGTLRKSKFEHEIEYASINYEDSKGSTKKPRNAIGVRVDTVMTPMPFRKQSKINSNELALVANDEFALFPLNQSSPSHHLIVGATGSGKTTLILNMIKVALNQNWKVVCVDLKGDSRDVPRFLSLAEGNKKVAHFPTQSLDFWQGSKDEVTERLISMIPPNGEPHYLNRNITAVRAVVSRSEFPTPKSVSELITRFRSPKDFISDLNDFKLLSTKEKSMTVGEQVANDFISYLQPVLMAEENKHLSFSWNSDWDLALFTLDSFQPSCLRLGTVILNDFSLWMFSESRLKNITPVLLIIDEASALTQFGTPPVLSALLQRARSAQVSLVLASQTYTSFGNSTDEVINSGAIRWLGASSKVDEMIFATGAKSVVEVGHQEIDGKYSGVSTAREQRQFIIDPDSVRSLPTFHWFVSLGQKVSHLYVPPLG